MLNHLLIIIQLSALRRISTSNLCPEPDKMCVDFDKMSPIFEDFESRVSGLERRLRAIEQPGKGRFCGFFGGLRKTRGLIGQSGRSVENPVIGRFAPRGHANADRKPDRCHVGDTDWRIFHLRSWYLAMSWNCNWGFSKNISL